MNLNEIKEGLKVRIVNKNSNRYLQKGTVRRYDSDGVPYRNDGIVVEFDDGQRIFYSSEKSLERVDVVEEGSPLKNAWRSIVDFFTGFTSNKYR